jgi:hypothetical protein
MGVDEAKAKARRGLPVVSALIRPARRARKSRKTSSGERGTGGGPMNPPPPSIGGPEPARSLGEGRVLGEERGAAGAGDCEARTVRRSRLEEFGSVGADRGRRSEDFFGERDRPPQTPPRNRGTLCGPTTGPFRTPVVGR